VTTVDPVAVAAAVAAVRERIRVLAGDRSVELIAVTKGFGRDAVEAAIAAGCHAIGENYAQELRDKLHGFEAAVGMPAPVVHFIGGLQTNKVRVVAGLVDVWQSVDRIALADEIVRRRPGATVFVQVNTTGEQTKSGCRPEDVGGLVVHCARSGLAVEGLMTIGPTSGDRASTVAAFALLARLGHDNGLRSLSMGMSADLDLAVAHGATHVRIGSALFGPRPHRSTQIG